MTKDAAYRHWCPLTGINQAMSNGNTAGGLAEDRRRIGRFFLHERFLAKLHAGEGTNIFDGMVVLRTEQDIMSGRVQYLAMHPQFRPVEIGEITPEYVATFEAGSATPKWQEQPR